MSLLSVVTNTAFVSIKLAQVAVNRASGTGTSRSRRLTGCGQDVPSGASSVSGSRGDGNYCGTVSSDRPRLLDAVNGTGVDDLQSDARAMSQQMVSSVHSISTSLMKGTVSGEEPVSVAVPSLSLSLQRVSVTGTTATAVSTSSGASIALSQPASLSSTNISGTDDRVDIRAVSWLSNPHGWSDLSVNLTSQVSTYEVARLDGSITPVAALSVPVALTVQIPS